MRINHRVCGAFCAAVALLAGSTGFGQDFSNSWSQQPDCITRLVPVNYNPATGEYLTPPELPYPDCTPCSAMQPSTDSQFDMQEPVMLLDEAPSYDQPCGCCSPPPCWSALGESVWFQRSRADRFPLSFPGSNDPDIMSTRDQNYGTANGYRVTLAKAFACSPCTNMEASYLGIDGWNGQSQIVDPNRMIDSFLRASVPNAAQFRNAFSQTATAETSLNSVEFNARRYFYPNDVCIASALAGFRYIHIADDFQLLSHDQDPAISPDDIGLYTVHTKNNLVGGQIGGSLASQLTGRFSAGAKLKTGIFANFNEQKGRLLNVQPPNAARERFSHATGTSLAAMVETGLFVNYQFSPNCGVRGGYDVFIISGLALTANQLDFTANQFQGHPFINDTSTLVFHGPTVGLWARW